VSTATWEEFAMTRMVAMELVLPRDRHNDSRTSSQGSGFLFGANFYLRVIDPIQFNPLQFNSNQIHSIQWIRSNRPDQNASPTVSQHGSARLPLSLADT